MTRKALNVQALYDALDLVRSHTGKAWRDLAAEMGVSASTFSRMAAGNRPDADALVTMLAWLRVPVERFTVDSPEALAAEPTEVS